MAWNPFRRKKQLVKWVRYDGMTEREMDEALETGASFPVWDAVLQIIDEQVQSANQISFEPTLPNDERNYYVGGAAKLTELKNDLEERAGAAAGRLLRARREERKAKRIEDLRLKLLEEERLAAEEKAARKKADEAAKEKEAEKEETDPKS